MNGIIAGYFICLLTTLILLLRFVCSKERNSLNYYFLLMILAISNAGYLALAVSKTLDEAILANKLTYFSGIFMPMLIFMVICEVCHIELRKSIIAIMYIVQFLIYGFVATIGYSSLYYESVELHQNSYGISVLSKVYGPTHMLYPITMYGYFIACLVVAVISLFRRNVVSYKNIIIIMVAYFIGIGGYVGERALHLEVEIVPYFNTIIFMGLSITVYRMTSYYIKDNIRKVQEATNQNCYIAFDKKLAYMGCNNQASELFPEILGYKLDRELPYSENMIYQKILPMLQEYVIDKEKNKKRFQLGYLTYECKIDSITREGNRTIGYLIELQDVTEHIKNLELARDYNRNLESEVQGKTQRIREIQDRTILGMAQMVESRDLSTGGHIKRTSSVINVFARELMKSDLGLSQQFLIYVEKSAPMHDLGKIVVDDQVLRKPGKFTDEEYAKMKQHSSEGARVVREILTGVEDEEFMNVAINVAHYHHEKMDGTGYPEGLKGEEIPIEARIMALADVFDALVSKRCYKDAFTYDKAFSIIEESAGSHFDPQLAEVFVKCRPYLEVLYQGFNQESAQ